MSDRVTWGESAYAGFWLRFAGILIDGLILAVVGAIVGALLAPPVLFDPIDPATLQPRPGYIGAAFSWFGASIVVWIIYDTVMIAWQGWTVGKRVVGVEVRDQHGALLSVGRSFVRALVKHTLSQWIIYLGYLWVLWDSRKQGWHDKLAGSYVLQRSWLQPVGEGAAAQPSQPAQGPGPAYAGWGIPTQPRPAAEPPPPEPPAGERAGGAAPDQPAPGAGQPGSGWTPPGESGPSAPPAAPPAGEPPQEAGRREEPRAEPSPYDELRSLADLPRDDAGARQAPPRDEPADAGQPEPAEPAPGAPGPVEPAPGPVEPAPGPVEPAPGPVEPAPAAAAPVPPQPEPPAAPEPAAPPPPADDPNRVAIGRAGLSQDSAGWLDQVAAQVDPRLDRVAAGWRSAPQAPAARACAFGLLLGHLARRYPHMEGDLSRVAEAHPSFSTLLAGSRLSTLQQIADDPGRATAWLGPLIGVQERDRIRHLFD